MIIDNRTLGATQHCHCTLGVHRALFLFLFFKERAVRILMRWKPSASSAVSAYVAGNGQQRPTTAVDDARPLWWGAAGDHKQLLPIVVLERHPPLG